MQNLLREIWSSCGKVYNHSSKVALWHNNKFAERVERVMVEIRVNKTDNTATRVITRASGINAKRSIIRVL